MAQNHIQKGDRMTYENTSGAAIEGGQAVKVGNRIFVSFGDIPDGGTGELAAAEVWELPKAAEAIAQGVEVFWDTDGNPVGGVAASGAMTATATANTGAGYAFAPAADTDTTVLVKLC